MSSFELRQTWGYPQVHLNEGQPFILSLKLQASEGLPWHACIAESVLYQNGASDGVFCKLKIEQTNKRWDFLETKIRANEVYCTLKMRLIHFLDPQLSKMPLFKLRVAASLN